MTHETITRAVQEDILAFLGCSDEFCEQIVREIDAELFEGDYRVIAECCIEYINKYGKAPKAHISSLPRIAKILEDPHNRRAKTYEHILASMDYLHYKKTIDPQFVLDSVRKFREQQTLKAKTIDIAEDLNAGRIDEAAKKFLSTAEGLDTGQLGYKPGELHGWDDPDWSLLDDSRGDLPTFPIGIIEPEALRQWIENAAAGSGTSIDHVVGPLFGVASSLIGTARRVQASPGFTQPMTLWTIILTRSGGGKSPAIRTIKELLDILQMDQREAIGRLRREHETRAQEARHALERWKARCKAADENHRDPPVKPEEADDPGPFIEPRLYTTDITIEKVAILLQARPQGMLELMDELAGLFLNMGRRGGSDRQFWLQAWDGDPYPVDRVGRPSFTLPHLLIGIVGGMQPDRLAEAFKGAADGMYTRFLFNWPAELSYEKMPRFYNERDSDISKMLERIVALPSTNSKDSRIKLTPEAVDTFEDLRRYVIKKRSALDGREHEWWAKVPAHVLRLAGTLRYMRWGIEGGKEPDAIHSKCVKTADDLIVGYFWPHARAALRLIGLSQRHGDARRVLKWLAGTGKRDITRETVRRDALSQRLDVNETQALLDQLEKAGWLRKAGSEGKGRGRPAIKYTINPQLFK